jgi:TRAP transporter TAXI family solute receptor
MRHVQPCRDEREPMCPWAVPMLCRTVAVTNIECLRMRRVRLNSLFLICVALGSCRTGTERPVTLLTIATGGAGGVYYPLGSALARLYSDAIPGVTASAQVTIGSAFNVQALEQGSVHIAFTQGDVAYLAYTIGSDTIPQPHANMRGMAVLYVNTVQIVTRGDSGIHRVRDLRGKRLGITARGSGTEVAARIIIEAHGVNYDEIKTEFFSTPEIGERLQDRSLDAGFLVSSYPLPTLTDASNKMPVRLLAIEPGAVERIRHQYPFFKPVTIPAGTYRALDRDLPTLGVDNILVCRADLPEALVYQLTRVFFDSLDDLASVNAAVNNIDPDRAPTTPIPLHPGAARYYRELELIR